MDRTRKFLPGDYVIHYRRSLLTNAELSREPNLFRYVIFGVAEHSRTGEKLMIYRQLFGLCKLRARPLDDFLAEVDHEKHPEVTQKYRFEKYIPSSKEETPL